MPKVAILSDVHGNLQALVAVLREVKDAGAEWLVVAGDMVGYGANPGECVDLLRRLQCCAVSGNHESYVFEMEEGGVRGLGEVRSSRGAMAGIIHAVMELSGEQKEWLRGLPLVRQLTRETVVAHASLNEPGEWHYLVTEREARPSLELMRKRGVGLGFFGHTHRQAWFGHPEAGAQPVRVGENGLHLPAGSICAVVSGSVGQPREGDGDPRASWVLWDSERRVVEFRKTGYEWERAAEAILEAGLPEESAVRLGRGG